MSLWLDEFGAEAGGVGLDLAGAPSGVGHYRLFIIEGVGVVCGVRRVVAG